MHPMLNVAVRAAREAGKIINRASLDIDLLRVAQKAANDFVTEVDRAAEQAIIDVLLKAYPQHGILGEETGSAFGDASSEYQWIIDPLDGTTNFIHGMPVYAVSIAWPIAAWCNRPWFTTRRATNSSPPRAAPGVSQQPPHPRLQPRAAGRQSHRHRVSVSARTTTSTPISKCSSSWRSAASACAARALPPSTWPTWLAGRYDGFFETGLKPWDIAAGSLLITEAGGLVGNFCRQWRLSLYR
jgi:Archaeal fructose-1,6-bisphosphatase and related enzymes of inositol monophosphatase family